MARACSWAARIAGRKARTVSQEKRRVPLDRLYAMSIPPSRLMISILDPNQNLEAPAVEDEQAADNGEGGRGVRRLDWDDEFSFFYRDPVMIDHEVLERIRVEVGYPGRIPTKQGDLHSPSSGRLDEPGFIRRELGRAQGFWISGREPGKHAPGIWDGHG